MNCRNLTPVTGAAKLWLGFLFGLLLQLTVVENLQAQNLELRFTQAQQTFLSRDPSITYQTRLAAAAVLRGATLEDFLKSPEGFIAVFRGLIDFVVDQGEPELRWSVKGVVTDLFARARRIRAGAQPDSSTGSSLRLVAVRIISTWERAKFRLDDGTLEEKRLFSRLLGSDLDQNPLALHEHADLLYCWAVHLSLSNLASAFDEFAEWLRENGLIYLLAEATPDDHDFSGILRLLDTVRDRLVGAQNGQGELPPIRITLQTIAELVNQPLVAERFERYLLHAADLDLCSAPSWQTITVKDALELLNGVADMAEADSPINGVRLRLAAETTTFRDLFTSVDRHRDQGTYTPYDLLRVSQGTNAMHGALVDALWRNDSKQVQRIVPKLAEIAHDPFLFRFLKPGGLFNHVLRTTNEEMFSLDWWTRTRARISAEALLLWDYPWQVLRHTDPEGFSKYGVFQAALMVRSWVVGFPVVPESARRVNREQVYAKLLDLNETGQLGRLAAAESNQVHRAEYVMLAELAELGEATPLAYVADRRRIEYVELLAAAYYQLNKFDSPQADELGRLLAMHLSTLRLVSYPPLAPNRKRGMESLFCRVSAIAEGRKFDMVDYGQTFGALLAGQMDEEIKAATADISPTLESLQSALRGLQYYIPYPQLSDLMGGIERLPVLLER